jgi:hypothetical protein
MQPRSPVTLSDENGLSRSRPCQESRSDASGRQRPPCAPLRSGLPNAVPQLEPGAP